VTTNDVSDYINLLVRMAHIICNHAVYHFHFTRANTWVGTDTVLRAGRSGFNSRHGQWWELFLRHRVQTGSEAHPASYAMGTGALTPRGKSAGAWRSSMVRCLITQEIRLH